MSKDFLHEYELIMYDMAKWISEKMWGGHEAGCPRFGTDEHEGCECVFRLIKTMHATIKECQSTPPSPGLPDFTPRLTDMQAEIWKLTHEVRAGRRVIEGLLAIVAQSPNDDDWRGRSVRDARAYLNGCPHG